MANPPARLTRRGFVGGTGAMAALVATAPFPAVAEVTAPRELSFLVIGDWGHLPDDHAETQHKVARAMAARAAAVPIDFVISTGDNLYPRGAAHVSDPIFKLAFEEVYAALSLNRPWYLALGNHDHAGDAMAEVAYTAKSERWNMPSPFFRLPIRFANGASVDFFFIDTTTIAGKAGNFVENWFGDRIGEQLDWLDQTLLASTAAWKIVVGHHPIHSGGEHGDTASLVERVKPLMLKHCVQAYIHGHDHNLQHREVEGIHYVTSGGGSGSREVRTSDGARFAASSAGFMAASLSSEALAIEFFDEDGGSLHAGRIERKIA